jgi:hypothetical protein
MHKKTVSAIRHSALTLLLLWAVPAHPAPKAPQNSGTQTAQKSAQPEAKAKAQQPARKTAMQIPEPSSLILFGGAILLLLIARQFGRARIKPAPEETWAQD